MTQRTPEGEVPKVLDAMRTGARQPVGGLGEEQHMAPVWLVRTERRMWAVAAEGERSWSVAVGGASGFALDRGWVTDAVRVGGHLFALRTGTRRQAVALEEAWNQMPGGASSLPPPRAPVLPGGRGAAAPATVLPSWWTASVPAAQDERWFLALETAETFRFPAVDGDLESVSIWLGVSERQVVLVARGERELRVVNIEEPMQLHRRGGRARFSADGVEVAASVWTGAEERLVPELTALGTPERWARFGRFHVEQGRPDRALEVWSEALAIARGEACWADVARFAWVACSADLAHVALVEAIRSGRIGAGDRTAWGEPIDAWQAAVSEPQRAAADLAESLYDAFAALRRACCARAVSLAARRSGVPLDDHPGVDGAMDQRESCCPRRARDA